MSDSYTKLFSSITKSTVWGTPPAVRCVWVAMLADSNRHGEVFGSVPGLARLALVSLQECEEALAIFLAPDPHSRTKDHEGRRIEEIDGGWRLLNYVKFDRMRSEAEAKEREIERKRDWDRKNRSAKARAAGHPEIDLLGDPASDAASDEIRRNPTPSVHPAAVTTEQDQKLLESSLRSDSAPMVKKGKGKISKAERLRQIVPEAIAAYNSILTKPNGVLPKVRPGVGVSERTKQVKRCTSVASEVCIAVFGRKAITPEFWEAYFTTCSEDPFKSGRQKGGEGHENWKPDFEYLTRPAVMLKAFEKAMAEAEE